MSKELTEQWRNGTLPLGAYYVNYQYNNRVWLYQDKSQTPENTTGLFEVLAKVPTYDEWKTAYECQLMESEEVLTLKEQLSEANAIIKSLKDARSQSVNEYLEKWGAK